MIRNSILVLALLLSFASHAQTTSDSTQPIVDTSHLRISLITCGVGEEVWELFGHAALRVMDSVKGTDNVYNYGTFDGFAEGFELKFMQGKLLYYVSYYPYYMFLREYEAAGRSVQEQVLILDGKKKENIYDFLRWNASEENKYYKYDFFYDNCATRIRDVFPKTFGKYLVFGKTIPDDSKMTFRNIINEYFYRTHFTRLGINILLGSRIDKIMSNEDIMFLPDYLRDGVGNATVKGQKVATPPVTVLSQKPAPSAGINWAFVLTALLSILTIAGLVFKPLHPLGKVMSTLFLLVTGLIGCLILVMWFGTDHQGCQNNFNLLWALPTNALIAFASKRNKDKYAIVAILLILVSFILHLLKIQELPLLELSPVLLALLFIYGMIYRKNKLKTY